MSNQNREYNCKVGVDAGNISVIDYGYLIKNMGKDTDLVQYRTVSNGWWDVTIIIEESWNGSIVKHGRIKVTKERIAIGDACYQFDDEWSKFLDKTKYLKDMGEGGISIDTGGDGRFDVKVNMIYLGEELNIEDPKETKAEEVKSVTMYAFMMEKEGRKGVVMMDNQPLIISYRDGLTEHPDIINMGKMLRAEHPDVKVTLDKVHIIDVKSVEILKEY